VPIDFRKDTDVSVSIKPLEDRILVKSLEAETTTASGPGHPGHRQGEAAGGRGPRRRPRADRRQGQPRPVDVKVGDRVIYSKYGGTEIKHGGQEYLLLSARDVLAVVG
jgi:chaperonin GroES